MRELRTKWAKRLLLVGSIVATFLISSTVGARANRQL